MADDQIQMSTYPIPVYNYRVQIGETLVSFSEVSGLSISYESTTFKESRVEAGVPGPRVVHMPSQAELTTLTMKKGLVRKHSVAELYAWISTVRVNHVTKKDITVMLDDEEGQPLFSWQVLNAFPTALEIPDLDANATDAAIETLQLIADDIKMAEAGA